MKATGEVMAIAPSLEMALMKAIRSLEEKNIDGLISHKLKNISTEQIEEDLRIINNDRIWVIAEALRRKITIEKISKITTIDPFFIDKMNKIVLMEQSLRNGTLSKELILKAKRYGFTDQSIAALMKKTEKEIKDFRISNKIIAAFKMVDTCAGEFDAASSYYYSSYDEGNEVDTNTKKKKILIIGSGPIRIGQGIEFDYCSVHCV
jgi:carbamoyl-phosphate synthase large subunit